MSVNVYQRQGMIYLHKSVFQSHGYLSSANCHVDSRWVLKISGFALHVFRSEACREQVVTRPSKKHFNAIFSGDESCFRVGTGRRPKDGESILIWNFGMYDIVMAD